MSIPFPQIVVGTGTLLWNVWNSLILSLSYQFLLHCCSKLHGHCAQDSNHRGREVFIIQPQCDKRTTTTKNLKWYEVVDGTTCVSWKILNFINNIVVTINVGKGAEIQSRNPHFYISHCEHTLVRILAYTHCHSHMVYLRRKEQATRTKYRMESLFTILHSPWHYLFTILFPVNHQSSHSHYQHS